MRSVTTTLHPSAPAPAHFRTDYSSPVKKFAHSRINARFGTCMHPDTDVMKAVGSTSTTRKRKEKD